MTNVTCEFTSIFYLADFVTRFLKHRKIDQKCAARVEVEKRGKYYNRKFCKQEVTYETESQNGDVKEGVFSKFCVKVLNGFKLSAGTCY